jgi:hypothetical protein
MRYSSIIFAVCVFALTPNGGLAAKPAVQPAAAETVIHAIDADFVEFAVSARPSSVRLQGLVETSGRWVNLVTKQNPPESLSRLEIPSRWRGAQLRVLATYPSLPAQREQIPVTADWNSRHASFVTKAGARLFSVEYKSGKRWKRISTVAATEQARTVNVPIPASLPSGSKIRVIAVSGQRKAFPTLATSLPLAMVNGPSTFAPKIEAVAPVPGAIAESDFVVSAENGRLDALAPVEESDIWKIRGSKIYFFNRLRGLQIIDASNPEEPAITGSLRISGSGEEMYLPGAPAEGAKTALVLTGLGEGCRLSRIDLAGDTPSVQAEMDLPGYYVESRLVGGLLHVVTSSWSSDSLGNWSPQTHLITLDVSQNGLLVELSRREFDFAASTVGSTAKYFWIAANRQGSWYDQQLLAFAYKTDGSLSDPLSAEVGGMLQDKFKVGDTSDGLAAVVQRWDSNWQRVTSVKTFREDDGLFSPLASLELVRNESLFATRFGADRLYVVTFEQVDPLWVVDLADPADPQIKGHLEVPGWSTFIQPVGDTLIAVGRDGGKVQVSMFDVADPANPTRSQKIDIGGGNGGWSWSEAEWNEKAASILPEAGLILLPIVDWSNGKRSNRVSIVDFDVAARTLTLRGTIDHDFAPRRAAMMDNDVIASVSNRELLLVDAKNRDFPMVSVDVTLAFGVDRILVHNGLAYMFENGGREWLGSPSNAILRIASAADTESVKTEVTLPCQEVGAAQIFNDRLVTLESSGSSGLFLRLAADDDPKDASGSYLGIWALQDPAKPAPIARVPLPFVAGSEVELLPVEGGRVAVVSRDRGWNYWIRPLPIFTNTSSLSGLSDARVSLPWIGWGGQRLRIAIVDVGGTVPAVVGQWEFAGDEYTGISEVFSAGDLLAFSFDRRETAPAAAVSPVFDIGLWSGWSSRSWLQILDLADPSSPMPWAPVQLPGELLGVSWLQRAGGVVFARSAERVAALGFDGESASVVAEVAAGPVVAMQGSTLYANSDNGVSEWTFSEDGRWRRRSGWSFDPGSGINELHVTEGALLAGNWRHAWILREDGSVSAHDLPAGSSLGGAAPSGEEFIIPSGEYGAIRLY